MTDRHDAIVNFLKMVKEAKGEQPRIAMQARYKKREESGARGSFATGFAGRDAGTSKQGQANAPGADTGQNPAGRESRFDGALYIGETVSFSVHTPASGYLRLFNFGSSGRCLRLFPNNGEPSFFRQGQLLAIPAQGRWFDVNGPATDVSGYPDRLFALLLDRDVIYDLAGLDPRLEAGSRGSFGGEVRRSRSPLFEMPSANWEYGLLEYETRDQN
ncbi:MAG: DUF4384 domain-containing protein [bacterium]|nr:DUF4384 domain-containing protein [bacterium]